ncbi:MAG: DUF1565 domain-containing protein [Deltaproteobacteria bacterium]|nr:DUF1565 domain-containing protein [Deltaproteobacteria bacterium]
MRARFVTVVVLTLLTSCVRFAKIDPPPIALIVELLPSVIAVKELGADGRYILAARVSMHASLTATISVYDADTLLAEVAVADANIVEIPWSPPPGEDRVHTLTFVARDSLGRATEPEVHAVSVELALPAITAITAKPVLADRTKLDLTWTVSGDFARTVLSYGQTVLELAAPTNNVRLDALAPDEEISVTASVFRSNGNGTTAFVIGTPGVLFVQPGANAAIADGASARPYATIGAALMAASSATPLIVHAGAGTYSEASGESFPIIVPPRHTLRGQRNASGALESIISGSGPYTQQDPKSDVDPGTPVALCPAIYAQGDASKGAPSDADAPTIRDLRLQTPVTTPPGCTAKVGGVISYLTNARVSDLEVAGTGAQDFGIAAFGARYPSAPRFERNIVTGAQSSATIFGAAYAQLVRNTLQGGSSTMTCLFIPSAEQGATPGFIMILGNTISGCRVGVSLANDARVILAADNGVRNTITVGTTSGGTVAGVALTNSTLGSQAAVCGTDITVTPSTGLSFGVFNNAAIRDDKGFLQIGSTLAGGPTIACDADPTVRIRVQTREVHGVAIDNTLVATIAHLVATNEAYAQTPAALAQRPAGIAYRSPIGSITVSESRVSGFPINLHLAGVPNNSLNRPFNATDVCVDASALAGQGVGVDGFPAPATRDYDDYGASGAANPAVNFFSSSTDRVAQPGVKVDRFVFARSPAMPPCPQ